MASQRCVNAALLAKQSHRQGWVDQKEFAWGKPLPDLPGGRSAQANLYQQSNLRTERKPTIDLTTVTLNEIYNAIVTGRHLLAVFCIRQHANIFTKVFHLLPTRQVILNLLYNAIFTCCCLLSVFSIHQYINIQIYPRKYRVLATRETHAETHTGCDPTRDSPQSPQLQGRHFLTAHAVLHSTQFLLEGVRFKPTEFISAS